MDIRIKVNNAMLVEMTIKNILDKLGLAYDIVDFNSMTILLEPQDKRIALLENALKGYHMDVLMDRRSVTISEIKMLISEYIQNEKYQHVKLSHFLSEELHYSYNYLSNLFSECTYSTIEYFVILKRIEYTKELFLQPDLSLTQIAYRLKYSSVAHLSGQFKKVTGLTPSVYKRIIQQRYSYYALNYE